MSTYFRHIFKRGISLICVAVLIVLGLVTPNIAPAQASGTSSSAAPVNLPTVNCRLPINYPQPDCREAIAQALAQRKTEMAYAAKPRMAEPGPHNAPASAKSTAAHANVAPGDPPTDCNNVVEIPTIECQGLLALYASTGGASWTSNSGWNTTTPCSSPWFGVTCPGGHVTRFLWLVTTWWGQSLPP